MATKRTAKTLDNEVSEKTRETKPNNSLKIRIDDLKTFDPLTAHQKNFYDAYKQGDYFIALHGVAEIGRAHV